MVHKKNNVISKNRNIENYSKDLFEYWLPRLTADGVDTNDVLRVHRKVSGWSEWPCAWSKIGDNYLSLAKTRKGCTLIKPSVSPFSTGPTGSSIKLPKEKCVLPSPKAIQLY